MDKKDDAVIHLLWMSVILLHKTATVTSWRVFLVGNGIQFYRATLGQGWMAVSKKSSRVLDTRLLRAHCSGFPQCLSLALSPTMIHTFH